MNITSYTWTYAQFFLRMNDTKEPRLATTAEIFTTTKKNFKSKQGHLKNHILSIYVNEFFPPPNNSECNEPFLKYWQPCDPALRCNHYNYMGNQSDMQSIMVPVVCHH